MWKTNVVIGQRHRVFTITGPHFRSNKTIAWALYGSIGGFLWFAAQGKSLIIDEEFGMIFSASWFSNENSGRPENTNAVLSFSACSVLFKSLWSGRGGIGLKGQVTCYRALWERARNGEQELVATIPRMKQEHNAEVDQIKEKIGKVMKWGTVEHCLPVKIISFARQAGSKQVRFYWTILLEQCHNE